MLKLIQIILVMVLLSIKKAFNVVSNKASGIPEDIPSKKITIISFLKNNFSQLLRKNIDLYLS